jgi:hypothetical protein
MRFTLLSCRNRFFERSSMDWPRDRKKHALAKKEKRDQTYLGMRMYTAVVVMIVCDSNSVCNLILLIGN